MFMKWLRRLQTLSAFSGLLRVAQQMNVGMSTVASNGVRLWRTAETCESAAFNSPPPPIDSLIHASAGALEPLQMHWSHVRVGMLKDSSHFDKPLTPTHFAKFASNSQAEVLTAGE
jgi:hypothetical protein